MGDMADDAMDRAFDEWLDNGCPGGWWPGRRRRGFKAILASEPPGVWVTKEGTRVEISQLSTEHLNNILAMVAREDAEHVVGKKRMKNLRDEAARRAFT